MKSNFKYLGLVGPISLRGQFDYKYDIFESFLGTCIGLLFPFSSLSHRDG